MPLDFECNKDPREMKSINGKKYCDECKKFVFDVRRKSVDKIVALKKERGELCMIIYDDQLERVQSILDRGKKTEKSAGLLPYAGAAALSLFTLNGISQNKDAEGKVQQQTATQSGVIEEQINVSGTETLFRGRLDKVPKAWSKKQSIQLLYYDTISQEMKTVLTFRSNKSGYFEFRLDKAQKLLLKDGAAFEIRGKTAYENGFDVTDTDSQVILEVYKRHRRKTAGALF
jgi:hypothetical protein